MSIQHKQFSILLLLMISIQAICPILCASIGEKSCNLSDAFAEIRQIDDSSSCCHKTKTGETELPSEHAKSCCFTDMLFVVSNDSHLLDCIGKTEGQQFASVLPFTVFFSNSKEIFLSHQPTTNITHTSSHNVISRRGTPLIHS